MRKLITILCLCSFVIARGQTWSYSYWFDANTEQQQTGTYTGNALQLDIPTDGLSDWFHTLHIQVTDAEGKSSPVLTRTFAIVPQSTADRTPARYRYWFDNDEAGMQTGTMTGNTFSFDMPVATLSNWFHTMHYQVQDASGQWSPVLTRTFAVIPEEAVANRDLTGQPYRYWLDDNDAAMQTGTLAGNALELEVAVDQLPQGFHYLHLQVQDDLGNWSPALAKEFMVGMEDILPWGTEEPWESKYVFTDNRDNYADPAVDANGRNWTELEYNDSLWQTLTGPMSDTQDRWDNVGYIWEGDNNCFNLRRTFSMDSVPDGKYQLLMHHDDGVRVYLNGQLVVEDETYGSNYTYNIPQSAFVAGQNILAIYVEEKSGGQCLDYCLRYKLPETATSITLNTTDLTLAGGEFERLKANVTPEEASDRIVWSVADPAIARVNSNGVVTALMAGTTTVTAAAKDNDSIKAECNVTVTSDFHLLVPWGTDEPWEAKYSYWDNVDNYQEPEADANGNSWTVMDYDDSSWPMLTGPMANNMERVNYQHLWDKEHSCYVLRRVIHLDEKPAGVMHFCMKHDDDTRVYVNGQQVINVPDFTYDEIAHFEFPSSALHEGDNMLAIYIQDTHGGWMFLDYAIGYRDSIAVSSITLNETQFSQSIGQRVMLQATVLPEEADDKRVTWSVADESVATVNEDGLVTIVGEGTTTVTATSVSNPSVSATCIVTGVFQGEATFDGLVARVSGVRTLDDAFAGIGREEAAKTIAAVVWNGTQPLTDNMLEGIDNPNLLVYVSDAAQAPATVKNVVVDGVAKEIVLADTENGNNNFFVPQAFTAERISYSHNYTQQTTPGVSRGWETLVLPFAVQTVTHERNGALLPYKTQPGDKTFWLRTLTADGIKAAQRIVANMPYLISMPNNTDAYDAEYCQGGVVTFASENVTVPETQMTVAALADSSVVLRPTMQRVAQLASVYALNVGEPRGSYLEGSVFERDLRDVRPFECYTEHRGGTGGSRFITLGDMSGGNATGIDDLQIFDLPICDLPIYNVAGQMVNRKSEAGTSVNSKLPKGVYIQRGRKVVIR